MARLLGIRIKNFRSLADFSLGQAKYGNGDALPRLACLIGPNGSGKSTVLDAFGFIADALIDGVEVACDRAHRGGFASLRTQGATGPIEFEIFFDGEDNRPPIGYLVHIDVVGDVPKVVKETLRQREPDTDRGRPYHFLNLDKNGNGKVWAEQAIDAGAEKNTSKAVRLVERNRLGIATLGNFAEHPRIGALRTYIEQWYLSYFVPDAARELPPSGPQRWLDRKGSNVANVLQYFQRQYPSEFEGILKRLADAIPGLKKITPEPSADRRLLLSFKEEGYPKPFFQQNMSDGTLKMLAYAVLLEDPSPRPFIGIEEPENGMYVRLVESLAGQFVERSKRKKASTQLLVTTHSPYFVDALTPDQVWLIRKNRDGHSVALRAADIPLVQQMSQTGIPLGALWYSNHLEGASP
jgi:predicted ATPase